MWSCDLSINPEGGSFPKMGVLQTTYLQSYMRVKKDLYDYLTLFCLELTLSDLLCTTEPFVVYTYIFCDYHAVCCIISHFSKESGTICTLDILAPKIRY